MRVLAGLAIVGLAACSGPDGSGATSVLVFTLGIGHEEAVAAATSVLPARLEAIGLSAHITADATAFSTEALAAHRAVVFLNTSGNDILDDGEKTALEEFVRRGGGWVGIHAASATEQSWPFYQDLIVAPFAGHPEIQMATVDVVMPQHPAMVPVGEPRWTATDEWYNFARDPGAVDGVHVLATLDETTYTGGTMASHHPIIWAHERLGGRALYSALGHLGYRWSEPAYVDHVVAAIAWAAGD